jgi:hypothetical protein
MSLRRIAGVTAAAAVIVSGAGFLLSSPTGAVTPPTPLTLDASGMSSSSCQVPLGVYQSITLRPTTKVQFEPGVLSAGTTESLTIKPAPNSTHPASYKFVDTTSADSAAPITFTRAATYSLTWHITTPGALGVAAVTLTHTGKLVVGSSAAECVLGVQLPVASVSASALPSPITSAVNGGLGAVASVANSALNPVNSALPTIPPLPTSLPSLPPLPGVPPLPGAHSPGASAPAGGKVPGTIYKPHGPTVADRTVPDGYGSGSGLGGVYVPVSGKSINAPAQQSGTGHGQQAGTAGGSSAAPVKAGGSPKTVELASNRPRSALGALPTLAVILAILALSGATAFYARTFLLQPAVAPATASAKD